MTKRAMPLPYTPFDPARQRIGASARGAEAVVGIAPTIVYDKMREIERVAADLGPKIHTYVADPTFVRAWDAWEADWTRFYQKYQSDLAKLGAVFYTEELDQRTEKFRNEIRSFYDTYKLQRQTSGALVPAPVLPAPEPGTRPKHEKGEDGFSLPWWFWTLLGVGLVGAGYWAYLRYRELQAKRHVLETKVLPGLIGPGLAEAAAARDPRMVGSPPSPIPRSLADYAAMAQGQYAPERAIVYRPYAHPHLVPAHQRFGDSAQEFHDGYGDER